MTVSEFLGYCARSIEAGIPVQGSLAPKGWGAYVGLTLPQDSDDASPEEVVSTRVLRFLLAQAIAKWNEDEAARKVALTEAQRAAMFRTTML
jgi:hypothetical protein